VANGSIKENSPVAAKAVAMAMRRDAATGEYVDVVTISKGGFRRMDKDDVLKLVEN